jgi:hypothetical protein
MSSFLRWNIPYRVIAAWQALAFPEEFNSSTAFPEMSQNSDIEVTTPSSDIIDSTGAVSTLSQAFRMKQTVERAQLFVQGRVEDLMLSMNRSEQQYVTLRNLIAKYLCYFRMTVQWLKQYWNFSFRTAKNWGRGPREWTANSLGFYNSREAASQRFLESPRPQNHEKPRPSQLCRWSIHLDDEDWDELSSISSGSETTDPEDESTWKPWPESWETPPFEQRLAEALQTNTFSTFEERELPLSISHVAKAADKSNELLLEALGFSIISRNIDLAVELIDKAEEAHVDVTSIYPYHLATSYLDGAETCCNLLYNLCNNLEVNLRQNYTNGLGHTVLDNLMIAVLKSHTRTPPSLVDQALAKEPNFKGEEVDICGRWDADSECYRALLADGKSSIPFEWKHKFCHTSAQAICHCLIALDDWSADLNLPSGLFLRYCPDCGLKLQLRPLHTLVLVAFQLAQSGSKGEDLFGALACLLCLLSRGGNPLLSVSISFSALLGQESLGICDHEELRPFDLAQRVPPEIISQWSSSARTGWLVFCLVLRSAQDAWDLTGEDDEDTDSSLRWSFSADIDKHFENTCEEHWLAEVPSYFGESIYLGHIWAAVQAELLSYRRLTESDPWLSKYFAMESLLRSVETGSEVSIGYVEQGLLKPYCRCGNFIRLIIPALLQEVVTDDVSNMGNDARGMLIWPY